METDKNFLLFYYEILLYIAHHPQGKFGGNMQVFCAWSSFKISACTVPRTVAMACALIFL